MGESAIETPSGKPHDTGGWAGCIDSVGSSTLATVLPGMKYHGSVAAVGLAGGTKLETTVIPFLLRGINLLGIDSVMCPKEIREEAWRRLGRSEERRVGKECVSTCRSRWSPYP